MFGLTNLRNNEPLLIFGLTILWNNEPLFILGLTSSEWQTFGITTLFYIRINEPSEGSLFRRFVNPVTARYSEDSLFWSLVRYSEGSIVRK